jgi:cell division initiation protein
MKIAPIDIAHKSFGRKFAGVDGDEVLSFLKEVAEEMEALIRERNQLKEHLRERELQMLEYKERDKALKDTIMTAHKMTEGMRKDSEREMGLIINDANQRAETIVRDARDSLKKTYQDISEMKRLKIQFEVALKGLLTSHLDLLERNAGYLPHVPNMNEAPFGATAMSPG